MIPTRLYIKQHPITGLMYFGKTTRNNVCSYKGSGKYWSAHLNEHGDVVNTIWVSDIFTNPADIEEFALAFSELFDIVESNRWANLKPENGLDGGNVPGCVSEEGRKRTLAAVVGIPKSEEHKQKIRNARAKQVITEEARQKMSTTRTGKKHSPETRQKMKDTQQRLAAERKMNLLSEKENTK